MTRVRVATKNLEKAEDKFLQTARELLQVDPHNVQVQLETRFIGLLTDATPDRKDTPAGSAALSDADFTQERIRSKIKQMKRRIKGINDGTIKPVSVKQNMKPIDPAAIDRDAEQEANRIRSVISKTRELDAFMRAIGERERPPCDADDSKVKEYEEHVKDNEAFRLIYGEYWLLAKREALRRMRSWGHDTHMIMVTQRKWAYMVAQEEPDKSRGDEIRAALDRIRGAPK